MLSKVGGTTTLGLAAGWGAVSEVEKGGPPPWAVISTREMRLSISTRMRLRRMSIRSPGH
jgi:hypothetical protein